MCVCVHLWVHKGIVGMRGMHTTHLLISDWSTARAWWLVAILHDSNMSGVMGELQPINSPPSNIHTISNDLCI